MDNKSGFLFFKPSDYDGSISRPTGPSILRLHGVTTLIMNSIACCAKLKANGDLLSYQILKDSEYTDLSESVFQLANYGYERRADMHWVPAESREKTEFEDYSIFDWACHGLSQNPNAITSEAQVHGICALLEIENAISVFVEKGWCAEVTNLLLSAAFLESQGRECRGNEYENMLREKIKTTSQQAISNMARNISIARHQKSPKSAERKFVYECWQNWQKTPMHYKSKAAFARSMLEKCEHLTSQKKIEDWCRSWESDAKTLTVPAE